MRNIFNIKIAIIVVLLPHSISLGETKERISKNIYIARGKVESTLRLFYCDQRKREAAMDIAAAFALTDCHAKHNHCFVLTKNIIERGELESGVFGCIGEAVVVGRG